MYYGIYKITNRVNGKMYIGQHTTDDLDDGYMGSGAIMKKALKKYGREAFAKEWLEFAENAEDLNCLERMYVDEEWLARPDTYNLVLGGKATAGFKHTYETKRKLSIWAKERLKDKENHPMYGRHLSEEQKEKQRAAHLGQQSPMKGKRLSEETRKKLSEARKAFCRQNPRINSRNSGKHWYNNGIESKLAFECPKGYSEGRI